MVPFMDSKGNVRANCFRMVSSCPRTDFVHGRVCGARKSSSRVAIRAFATKLRRPHALNCTPLGGRSGLSANREPGRSNSIRTSLNKVWPAAPQKVTVSSKPKARPRPTEVRSLPALPPLDGRTPAPDFRAIKLRGKIGSATTNRPAGGFDVKIIVSCCLGPPAEVVTVHAELCQRSGLAVTWASARAWALWPHSWLAQMQIAQRAAAGMSQADPSLAGLP
jgi:hypothetical protein